MKASALRSVITDRPARKRSALAVASPTQRARRTNDPLADINTKTARGRRIADLVRAYLSALGNPIEIERQAAVIAAAELQVLAEEARALALKQIGHADLDQVIRLQGAADRAVRKLGLNHKRGEPEPTLAEYLAARYGAERVEHLPEQAAAADGLAVGAMNGGPVSDTPDGETLTGGDPAPSDEAFGDEVVP